MSLYHYIKQLNIKPTKEFDELGWKRRIEWAHSSSIERIEKPTKLYRARELGYKAKQGYIIVRARVRRGGLRKRAIRRGRKPHSKGIEKITMKKSIRRIAEERVAKKYPNMEVLNSYKVGEDGKHKYYEVILVDPDHPSIKKDKKINWICDKKGRAYRGLTSAGKKGRGLRHKGN